VGSGEMSLVHKCQPSPGGPDYIFFCPGCQCGHGVWITHPNDRTQAMWSFNRDMEKPTFSPSLRIDDGQGRICHMVVTDGMLNFCGDSTHEMAGKSVAMVDF